MRDRGEGARIPPRLPPSGLASHQARQARAYRPGAGRTLALRDPHPPGNRRSWTVTPNGPFGRLPACHPLWHSAGARPPVCFSAAELPHGDGKATRRKTGTLAAVPSPRKRGVGGRPERYAENGNPACRQTCSRSLPETRTRTPVVRHLQRAVAEAERQPTHRLSSRACGRCLSPSPELNALLEESLPSAYRRFLSAAVR